MKLTCSGEQEEDDGQGTGGPVASHGHLSVLMKKRRVQETGRCDLTHTHCFLSSAYTHHVAHAELLKRHKGTYCICTVNDLLLICGLTNLKKGNNMMNKVKELRNTREAIRQFKYKQISKPLQVRLNSV